jgi:hypothetical protein
MSESERTPEQPVTGENRRARLVARALDGEHALDPTLFDRLQSQISPAPRQRRAWLPAALLPLTAAAVVEARALISVRSPLRLDLASLPPRAWIGYGVQCACICAALWIGARRDRRGFAWPSPLLRSAALTLMAIAGLTPLATRGLAPQPALNWLGAPCALVVALSGGCALIIAPLFYRRAVPIAAGAHAALLGVASAAGAGLVISLHCPGASFQHLLWGHCLPMGLVLPLAALALPRFLRP